MIKCPKCKSDIEICILEYGKRYVCTKCNWKDYKYEMPWMNSGVK